MIRTFLIIAASIVLFAVPAWGQTTQPAEKIGTQTAVPDQAWPKAVEAFAKSLSAGDLHASVAALSPRASVRRFAGTGNEELWRLAGRAEKSTIIGQHAYIHPPLVLAADIAADFKNAAGVSDIAKAQFLVDDETAIKRANATAVQWVVEQLEVREGTPVGVIVLWTPRALSPGVTPTDAPVYEALFVLCRGVEVGKHKFKINAVVYGNPASEQK